MIKRTLRSKNFRRMSGALLILTLSLTAITPIFAQDTTPPVATPAEYAWIGEVISHNWPDRYRDCRAEHDQSA